VRPLDKPAAERVGRAVAAAVQNDWATAWALLNGLTADELETASSVFRRLGVRAATRARAALVKAAVDAVRAGRAPRPASWDDALDVGRREGRSLRGPRVPVEALEGPSLSVVPDPAPEPPE
jgi:hypothetical protein